jgi:nucleoid DNA-binding protein
MKRLTQEYGGKRAIIRDVMAIGATARQASRAVNAVFGLMTEALSYHETVAVPGIGTLHVAIQKGTPKRRTQKTRNVATKQIQIREVNFPGRRRVVKLKPDPDLKLALSPRPTPLRPRSVKEILAALTPTSPWRARPEQCACSDLGLPTERRWSS